MSALLPQPEAEASLIQFVLMRGHDGLPKLSPGAFTDQANFIFYSAIIAALKRGRTPALVNICDYVSENPNWLRGMKEAAAARGMQPEAWSDILFQMPEPPASRGVMQDIAADLQAAYASRQAAEVGKMMIEGTIDPQGAMERLSRLDSSSSVPPKFADFQTLIADGLKNELPTVAEIMSGSSLLYAGRINEIHGEPGAGKTNIALAVASKVMQAGGTVLFLDPEDNPHGIARRFIGLGGNTDHLAKLFRYSHNPEAGDFPGLHEWARQNKPALVVHDGVAEGLAAEGYNEDKPAEVLQWFRERIRPFADAGSAVLLSDHVVKNTETRGRYARGSGAKLGRYDGASYEAQVITPYSPEHAGAVRLVVSKDRNGGVGPVGHLATEIHFTPGVYHTEVEFKQPAPKGEFRPTAIMDKIVNHLRVMPDASKNDLRRLGKAEYVDTALRLLAEENIISIIRCGQRMRFQLSESTEKAA